MTRYHLQAVEINCYNIFMSDTTDEIKDIAKLLGSKGGKKTLEKHGTSHFSNAGKLGMEKRWSKYREEKAKAKESTNEK
jgi:hypothetical protein